MYLSFGMHPVFLIFLAVIGVLLIAEHYLVRPDDLTHINMAFFHINSFISILLFMGVLTQAFFK
jgi:4-hydroxybenzoate polyprenyltransferase